MQISNPNFLQRWFGLNWFNNQKQTQNLYFNSRTNYQINKGQVFLDASVPYDLYNSIPQLKTPIDRLASMFSNGVFKLEVINTKELKYLTPELQVLLENPNVTQNQNDFLKQYLQQLIVYGNQFIYGNRPSSLLKVPKSLFNISSAYLQPVLTGKYLDQIDMTGIVKEYKYCENGLEKIINVNDILWSKINDLDNIVVGTSPIKSLKFPVSNTRLAYQYFNVISGEKGAIGVLSTEKSDGMGNLPMTNDEKAEIEATYRASNGIEDNQKKIHITTGTVKWAPMTYPTRDLLLQEQIDANFLTILNVLGVNKNIFINSTYDNLKHGLIQTHNDTIVPYADAFTQNLGKFIGTPNGTRLVLDYSHLPYLQADKNSEAQTLQSVSNALNSMVQGGIVTTQQANAILTNQFNISI